MKYWGILVAKLVGAATVLYAVWLLLDWWFYPVRALAWSRGQNPFMNDLQWTTVMFLYNLVCNAVLVLIVVDQRYRCRTCGRRLRMPILTGSRGQRLLLGPPRTEYICTYGHGTLKVSESQITGIESPDWVKNEDMWKELYELDAPDKPDPRR
jgi:hypothetical protein